MAIKDICDKCQNESIRKEDNTSKTVRYIFRPKDAFDEGKDICVDLCERCIDSTIRDIKQALPKMIRG